MTGHEHRKTSPSLSEAAPYRHPLGVSCTTDTDMTATFYCARCHQPFCEHCVGDEEGHKTYCLHCAAAMKAEEREEEHKRHQFIHPAHYHFMRWAALFVAVAVIVFNLLQIYRNHEQSEAPATPVATVSLQMQGITECRHRLQVLATAALSYRQTFERGADSLAEILPLLEPGTPTTDPVSHLPYILTRAADGTVTIRCPDPAAHGVHAIEVHPGEIARVIYSTHASARP